MAEPEFVVWKAERDRIALSLRPWGLASAALLLVASTLAYGSRGAGSPLRQVAETCAFTLVVAGFATFAIGYRIYMRRLGTWADKAVRPKQ